VLISGLVIDSAGDPVEGVDLDFTSAWRGGKRFTPKDNTDVDGLFAIAVPPGAYHVRFDPPAAGGLAPAELASVSLTGPTTLPTVQLQDAVTVSGVVNNDGGHPLGKLDLDFLAPASGQELPSSRDTTDGFGAFAASVNPGTYDLRVNPALASGWSQVIVSNVNANGNVNVGTIVLPPSTAPTVGGISPATGPTTGNTLVTVSGSGFIAGATVRIGGFRLEGVNVVSSTMLQGTTPVHPAGLVAVTVINPGALPVAAPVSYLFSSAALDPVLTIEKAGPLNTDLQLHWTSTGRPHYTIFHGIQAPPDAMTVLDATSTLSLRVDAAAAPDSPDLLFFSVH
jgi:hypothetical protein